MSGVIPAIITKAFHSLGFVKIMRRLGQHIAFSEAILVYQKGQRVGMVGWFFLHGDLELTPLFSPSVSRPSAAGLHGQLVTLCHSIPIVLWDRDYVCYPLTPF